MGMNKYLVTLRINGQLIKSVVSANSPVHARLLCQYQFGMGCVHVAPKQIQGEQLNHPLLDDLKHPTRSTIKPRPPKPPKTATIKPRPPTPEQMRVTQLKANVDRQKEALKRERERQKRQREAEQASRGQGGY